MAGYSKTKLIDKLGIKSGLKVYISNAPGNYFELIGALPPDIILSKKSTEETDFIHFFTKDRKQLEEKFPQLKKHLTKNGTLWISWPKRTSDVKSDLSENIVREIGLREGLVDVKVCAVDDVWSGLKFVYRVKER